MEGSLGISANEDTVESALKRSYRYRIPDYQRRYSWKKKQWKEMWNDLTALEGEETHFIGAVVLVERPGGLNNVDVLEIVDGQQRMTTISLLLAAMKVRYSREGEIDHARAIENDYLWASDLDQNRHQNITLNVFDNEDYRSILTEGENYESDTRLGAGFQFFEEKIADLSVEEINTLRKRLLKSFTLVSIECNTDHSAFRLFETLNNRGLELSAVDLIKNHVFNVASNSQEVNYKYIKNQWLRIVGNIIPTQEKPSLFFRHYLMSTPLLDISQSITGYTLYRSFREIVDKQIPKADFTLEDFLLDMADHSDLYAEILSSDIKMFDTSSNESLNQKLQGIHAIGMGQSGTLLLRLVQELENPNKLYEVLELLETFIIRQQISKTTGGSFLDRFYAQLCSNAFEDSNPVQYIRLQLAEELPSDIEFRTQLVEQRMTLNDRTKYILKQIEEEHFDGVSVSANSQGELEHIAPRAAYSAKKYSTWPEHLGVPEEIFQQYRDKIGNLTLLEKRNNAASSRNPFEQKKQTYLASEYAITQDVADRYNQWSIENIKSRTERLAEVALQTWKIDSVEAYE
jgi:uncharacterized protein with ParB-like and HNH nuclease domain